MRYFWLICLYIIIASPGFCQTDAVKLLTEKLNNATSDSLRADVYIDLHNAVFKTDVDKAMEYAGDILKYGQLAHSLKQIETGYLGLARCERKKVNCLSPLLLFILYDLFVRQGLGYH